MTAIRELSGEALDAVSGGMNCSTALALATAYLAFGKVAATFDGGGSVAVASFFAGQAKGVLHGPAPPPRGGRHTPHPARSRKPAWRRAVERRRTCRLSRRHPAPGRGRIAAAPRLRPVRLDAHSGHVPPLFLSV